MQPVKILHCADLHIGAAASFLGAAAGKRRYETLMTFERILQTAREHGVQLLLIAGDLFHSNNIEPELVDRVFEGFASLPETEIVIALGNHDPYSDDSPFRSRRLPENLHVFGGEDGCFIFERLGARVYGRSFTGVYMRGEERFSLIPPQDDFCNIMVLHGEATSNLSSHYNAVTSAFAASSGMDYIALGHVHQRSAVQRIGTVSFAYSGCPEGQGFDELGEKGVYLGEVSHGGCNLTFVPVCKRMHLCETVDISECTVSGEIAPLILRTLAQRCGEGYAENLYKIILTGETAEDMSFSAEELTERIGETVYYAKVCDKTTLRIDLTALAAEKSLKGVFTRRMLDLAEHAADEDDRRRVQSALQLGLKAFRTEVNYSDDQ